MKRIPLFCVALLLISQTLAAIEISREAARSSQGADQGFMGRTREWFGGLNLFNDEEAGSGCHIEEVQSQGDDPIIRENECEREICGGNFWGLSAVDICCNDQEITEGDLTYSRCWVRSPTRMRAQEEWEEIRNIIRGGDLMPRGHDILGREGSREDTSFIDLIVPTAEAHPWCSPSDHWSYDSIEDVSNLMNSVAAMIVAALRNGNPDEVGAPDSFFRQMVNDTLLVTQFLSHTINHFRFRTCPTLLLPLCEMIDDTVAGYWTARDRFTEDFTGQTHHLNSFVIRTDYAVQPHATIIAAHEGAHIVWYFANQSFRHVIGHSVEDCPLSGPAGWLLAIDPWDPVLFYESEFISQFIETIAYYFLPSSFHDLANETYDVWLDSRYHDLVRRTGHIQSGSQVSFYLPLNSVWVPGPWSERVKEAARLHQQLLERGGVISIGRLSRLHQRGDAHPSLHHDYLESPDVSNGPGGSSEYEAPAEDSDWDHPGNFQNADDPNENYPPGSCAEALSGSFNSSNPPPTECVDWCWDHFTGGRDRGPCESITDYDLHEECRFSSGGRCEAGRDSREGDCAADPSYQTSDFCVDACGSSGSPGYCDDLCVQNHTYPFCDNICRRGENYELGFCDEICRDDFSPDFCWSRCRFVSDSPVYCQSICDANPNDTMCDRRCERNFTTYCRTRCEGSPGLGFCRERCEERPTESFCTPERGEAGESEIVGSDVIDCPVAWFTTIGTLYQDDIELFSRRSGGGIDYSEIQEEVMRAYLAHYDNCDPYAGRMVCCRLAGGEEVCLPNGDNDACEEGGYCGCPVNGGVFEGCCMHPEDAVIAEHSCMIAGEGCSCLRQAIGGSCW